MVLYASNGCSLVQTSLYLFNISPYHHFNKSKCQAPRGKDKLCTPDHGHRPSFLLVFCSLDSQCTRGRHCAPRLNVGARGLLPIGLQTPLLHGVFCVIRVKGQLGCTTAFQHNVHFLQFSIAKEPDPGLGCQHAHCVWVCQAQSCPWVRSSSHQ